MKHQKESMSMYRKPKIEDSLARNMFSRSKWALCIADLSSKEVYNFL